MTNENTYSGLNDLKKSNEDFLYIFTTILEGKNFHIYKTKKEISNNDYRLRAIRAILQID